jgi:hypothetical protein
VLDFVLIGQKGPLPSTWQLHSIRCSSKAEISNEVGGHKKKSARRNEPQVDVQLSWATLIVVQKVKSQSSAREKNGKRIMCCMSVGGLL